MSKKQNANYQKHEISAFNNNPLIEAIRPAMDIKNFTKKIRVDLIVDQNVQQMDDFDRELMVELLDTVYLPDPELYTLYRSVLKAIMVSYLHRNPINSDTDGIQHQIATDKNYRIPDSINLSCCISCVGLSGAGKTVAIEKCFSLLPSVIQHNGYNGRYLNKQQIVRLKFEAPATKTKKGFVLNFLAAVDEALETPAGKGYYDEWKDDRSHISVLIQEAKCIAFSHSIGIVFVDEIQRCVGDDDKVDAATLSFIDNFFNSIGIPMVVAGTYAVQPLFSTTMSTARRLSSGRMFEFAGVQKTFIDQDDPLKIGPNPYFDMFVNAFYKPNLLRNTFNFDDDVKKALFYYSWGIQKLLIRLIKLCYEEAIRSGIEQITVQLIEDVYFDQFKLLHTALSAIREGTSGGYKDLIKFEKWEKCAQQHLVDAVIDKCSKSNSSELPLVEDDGMTIYVPPAKATYIPKDDLRNLSGMGKDAYIERFLGKKNGL
ncbi:ATP-binding protein [Flavobacterium sp.]|uniref:ATP-binding protein n=1 Tax=Flavobacterium sp. TaxID=239 RepID=UPI00261D4B7A|nr:ATP-binding protein [Flavobacterium sp.]